MWREGERETETETETETEKRNNSKSKRIIIFIGHAPISKSEYVAHCNQANNTFE